MPSLVIATRNAHKVDEIRSVLGDGFHYVTLRDLPGAPTPEETGATFAANAGIKAAAIAAWLLEQPACPVPLPGFVLADDSGLEVDALDGAPGVHSARYAAEELQLPAHANAPDAANNDRLLRELADVPPERRTARFRCVLALTPIAHATPTHTFDGTCEGRLGFVPRGAHGFGYDPLFLPDGQAQSFAELGESAKNAISHRARALAQLKVWLDAPSRPR
jgi:XTP/dITP diphosphohydrolase